jgi:hypothetical protein
MATDRSKGQTAVSISLSQELLKRIDARADALGLPRSQYIAMVVRKDVMLGGSLVVPTANAPKRVNLTDEAVEFLKCAIPALMEYERRGDEVAIPKPPEKLAAGVLWACFLNELDDILEDKWLKSEKIGQDIGTDRRHSRMAAKASRPLGRRPGTG